MRSQRVALIFALSTAGSALLAFAADANVKSCTSKTCGGRKIALAIDSSGSMLTTDPQDLRVNTSQLIIDGLVSTAEADSSRKADSVAVIDFDDSATVIYPLGDPDGAGKSLSAIDSRGGTYIADGVRESVTQIQTQTQDQTSGKSGIVVLTDGQDSSLSELVREIGNAGGMGIRVNFGFLNPSGTSSSQLLSLKTLLTAIIQTGGIYSTINSAETQQNFANLIFQHGLTAQDNNNPNGATTLLPGLSVIRTISKDKPVELVYSALAGEKLNFTVQALESQPLNCTLKDGGKTAQSQNSDRRGQAILTFESSKNAVLKLQIGTNAAKEGYISVGANSNMPTAIRPSVSSGSVPTVSTFAVALISLFSVLVAGTVSFA